MEYLKTVQKAVDYIEKRLTSNIKLENIAKNINLSPYYFHRLFHSYVGYSVGSYIRQRRLTEAADKLVETMERLIDIALEYGFQSQEAFTRAFKKHFGQTPAKYRSSKKHLYYFRREPLTDEAIKHLNGGITPEPKIIKHRPIKLLGMEKKITLKNNTIPQLWANFLSNLEKFKTNFKEKAFYGIFECESIKNNFKNFTKETVFNQVNCVELDESEHVPEGMVTRVIDSYKYAVFTHIGEYEKIKHTYDYIYRIWYPSSGYKFITPFNFEYYREPFNKIMRKNSRIDIYLPIGT